MLNLQSNTIMKLKCLGSSSSGNCYLLQSEKETLIIEAGVRIAEIKKSLSFSLKSVAGCVVTHRHRDHSASVVELCKLGIRVLALQDVFDSFADADYRLNVFGTAIEPMKGYKLGGFKIFAFSAVHDVECLGFVITHDECGKLLFMTDSVTLNYRFDALRHILVEANYRDDILQYNIDNGIEPTTKRERLLGTHCELSTTKRILRSLDLSHCADVVLLHLSDHNADAEEFKQEIEAATGKMTYVAHKGLEIELTAPF